MILDIFDLDKIRSEFPALGETDEQGQPYVYFDGPGGTQVPASVPRAMTEYFRTANANQDGRFETSRRNDQTIRDARQRMAEFLNAPSAEEIVFGQNMTSLTYTLSRSMGRYLQPGDEILVTRLDHDANVSPWVALQEKGVVIRWIDFNPQDCCLKLEMIPNLISSRTKLVAVGYASNAVGSINPVREIAAMAHAVGAWLWVDAVHYAPHGPIDVQALDCDFLVVSAYKFFGPHLGVLFGKYELLERLDAYKVRPADPEPPYKFETGTQNHEGLAGLIAAVDYLADLGQGYPVLQNRFDLPSLDDFSGRRQALKQTMTLVKAYESSLFAYLMAGMQQIRGVRVYGITDPEQAGQRCPTLAFTASGWTPEDIATYLGNQGIFVWNGNYYAINVTEQLGLEETGGMVRVGLAHYNTKQEVDRFLTAVSNLSS
jgi:cysteine desulfurase family protein (TIGR01976 family)